MPYQNRVTPFGEIIATPERGFLMGNRGILHDRAGKLTRKRWAGRAWLICLLAYKGWHREIMVPGQYTHLFFLDEASALAAGHRPCALCQRARFNEFRAAWAGWDKPRASTIDHILHDERLTDARSKRTHPMAYGSLAEGAMFVAPGEANAALLKWRGGAHRWSPAGYRPVSDVRFPAKVNVLTPPSSVAVLAAGYRLGVHPSAESA